MSSTPWKESTALILVTRTSVVHKMGLDLSQNLVVSSRVLPIGDAINVKKLAAADYRLLMVKRSKLSSFMSKAYVFPGGQVDPSDYSSKWWNLFERLGIKQEDLVLGIQSRVVGPRPPMSQKPTVLNEIVPEAQVDYQLIPEIALRISAIRKTFEETGIALLTDSPGLGKLEDDLTTNALNSVDLVKWRQKVRENGSTFIDLCNQVNKVPDIWSLYEWWNWLTPISVGHKRFDCMFYLCCLDKQPKVILDRVEVTNLKWCTPSEILSEHITEGVFLAPPQFYELSRLAHLMKFDDVEIFAKQREKFGIERWMPVISTYSDGAISLLPGDDAYPSKPDIIGLKPVPDFAETLTQMRSQVPHLNRIELTGPLCTCFCNCRLSCGHLTPVSALFNSSNAVDSKL